MGQDNLLLMHLQRNSTEGRHIYHMLIRQVGITLQDEGNVMEKKQRGISW